MQGAETRAIFSSMDRWLAVRTCISSSFVELMENGPLSLDELDECPPRDRTTTKPICKELFEDGLLDRQPDPLETRASLFGR